LDGFELFFGRARGEDVAFVGGQSCEDFGYLRGGLAFAEDHFGHALAEGAVVVELGEAEVFEGEMAQALDGLVGGQFALADLVEELSDGFGVHGVEIILDGEGQGRTIGIFSFAPLGLVGSGSSTHGLRRGLYSFAALRLNTASPARALSTLLQFKVQSNL